MKKITALLLAVFAFQFSSVFAEEIQAVTTSAPITTTQTEMTNTGSNLESNENQEEVVYNYYFSPTCGWCQKLNAFLEKNDGFEKLNINKIDVRGENGIKMIDAATEHGIDPSGVGTPFITYGPNGTGSYIEWGFYGAAEHFAQVLNVDSPIASTQENKSKSLLITLLGLIIIIAPLAYLGLKK